MKTTPPLKITGLLLFLLLLSAPLLAQRDTVFYPGTRQIHILKITNGKKQEVKEFFENGKLQQQSMYVDGKQEGDFKTWYASGKLSKVTTYAGGLREGKSIAYFENGKKSEESTYEIVEKGKKATSVLHGKSAKYTANGNTLKITNYKHGLKAGTEEEWFANGNKRSQVNYAADKRFGPFAYWKDNGKYAATGAYDTIQKKHGDRTVIEEVKTGRCKIWNNAGILTADGNYIKGKPEGKHLNWYDDGVLKSEITFRNGEPDGEQKSWFKNGQLNLVQERYMDYDSIRKKPFYRFEGRFEEYNDAGNIVKKGNYVKGEKHGPWVEYNKTVLVVEAEYLHGMLLHKHKVYYPNGRLRKEENYDLFRIGNRDTTLLNGESVEYHDNGAVRTRSEYVQGKLKNENNKIFNKEGFVTLAYFDEGTIQRKIEYNEKGLLKLEHIAVKEPGVSVDQLKYKPQKYYDENGTLRKKINYVNGKSQGHYTEWNEEGKVIGEAFLFPARDEHPSLGNIGNAWNALYYNNGQPWKEIYIRSSWGIGYEIEWYIDGKLKRVLQTGVFDAQWLQNGELFSLVFFDPAKYNQPKDTLVPGNFAQKMYQQYSNPKNKMLRMDYAPDGMLRSYYYGEQVRFETDIVKGIPNSFFRGYYPDGSLFVEWQLKNGIPDGKYALMNGNNTVYESGRYCNGKPCGDWVVNQVNGKPLEKYGIDTAGKRSYREEFYPENGMRRSLQTYRNGKATGMQKNWAPNGMLTSMYEMRNDTIIGESFNWNEKGHPQRHTTYNNKGIKEGLEESWSYKTSKKASEIYYVNNKKEGPGKTWWPNGQLRSEGIYANDLAEAYWLIYDDSTGGPPRKAFFLKGVEQVAPSDNPCECVEKKRDIRFCPLITSLVDSTHFGKWQFPFHEKISNKLLGSLFYMDYQNSYSREAMFNSLTLIAYKPIEVRLPDKNGIRLVLTPCKNSGSQISINANTEKANPDATHIEFSPYRLAFKFDDRLLKPTDKKLKNSEATFTVKFMEYEQQGITLHQPAAVCFNESFIGKTDIRLGLNNFIPVLTAKENATSRLLDSTWNTGSAFYTKHLQPHFRKNFNGLVNGNGTITVPYLNNTTLLLPARSVTSNDQFVALEVLIQNVKINGQEFQFKNNGKTINTSLSELNAYFKEKGFKAIETTASTETGTGTVKIQLFYIRS